MVCNYTAPVDADGLAAGVCAGIGQCLPEDEGVCTCPKGYSVLYDCEVTHYGVLPTTAFVTSLVFLIPFVIFSFIYTYEYVWNFVKRPKLRLSLLQIFNITMLTFCYTRAYGCFHFLVNSRIGHTQVWGAVARQLTVSIGLGAMLVGLAMVVSLWYDMVLSIRHINSKKSQSAKVIRISLVVGGIFTFVVGVAGAIYGVFLKTSWVTIAYTLIAVVYAGGFFMIASVSIHKSRSIWCGPKSEESKATQEFSRKVKVMIGWIILGIIKMISGLFFNLIGSPKSEVFFASFSLYNVVELALAILSLAFNQHYIYPFSGFNCCSGKPESGSTTRETTRGSRFSITTTVTGGSSIPSSTGSSTTSVKSLTGSEGEKDPNSSSGDASVSGESVSVSATASSSLSTTVSGTVSASTSTQT
eukprot:TRINITY_DN1354_c1_g6_i1.p1 TRINITY_DN1354_c1_g6~~TRINITY_DN1354_c1_g6_i1.p1  ORF type:complete len:414 (-),score=56.52 TRINITY_DN1354_c1_g6_i1:187-1428(-)